MIKRILYKILYYSYIIVYATMFIYLFLYIFILKYISTTYTYLLVLIIGIFLGYVFADTAHRYLKKRNTDI